MAIIAWRPFAFRDRSSVAAPITIPARMPSRVIFGIAASLLILAADAAAPAQAPPSTQQAPREEFLAAMQRVRLNLPEPPDSAALRNYSIYEYLLAARLRRDLSSAPNDALDTAVDGFLRAHSAQPVARALHREWLASLAQRRRWDWFLPRSTDVTDPQLVCDRLSGRLATGDTDKLGAEALARWSIPQRQPARMRERLRMAAHARLGDPGSGGTRADRARGRQCSACARIHRRDSGAARRTADAVAAVAGSAEAVAQPARNESATGRRTGRARLRFHSSVVWRLARRLDAVAAVVGAAGHTPSLQGRLRRAAALGAAYGRQPGAVAAFSLLPPEVVGRLGTDGACEPRSGPALRSGPAMDRADARQPRTQPRWRYWRARAVAAAAGAESAAPLFAEIVGLRDYYGYLAADGCTSVYDLNIHPTPVDAALDGARPPTRG